MNDLTLSVLTERDAIRFWAKVDKSGDCWLWTGGKGRREYGHFSVQRGRKQKTWRAHRASYVLANGSIPGGLFVLHQCDNPPCVNPAHLFLGTPLDNMRDMFSKGRAVSSERLSLIAKLNGCRGENIPWSKLTEQTVRELREEFKRGGVSLITLARRYGVSKATVLDATKRRSWAHVL